MWEIKEKTFPEIKSVSELQNLRVFFPSNAKISVDIEEKNYWITLVLGFCYLLLSLASADRYDFFVSLNTESLGYFACLEFQSLFSKGHSFLLATLCLWYSEVLGWFFLLFMQTIYTAAAFEIFPLPPFPLLCLWAALHSVIQPRKWVELPNRN